MIFIQFIVRPGYIGNFRPLVTCNGSYVRYIARFREQCSYYVIILQLTFSVGQGLHVMSAKQQCTVQTAGHKLLPRIMEIFPAKMVILSCWPHMLAQMLFMLQGSEKNYIFGYHVSGVLFCRRYIASKVSSAKNHNSDCRPHL